MEYIVWGNIVSKLNTGFFTPDWVSKFSSYLLLILLLRRALWMTRWSRGQTLDCTYKNINDLSGGRQRNKDLGRLLEWPRAAQHVVFLTIINYGSCFPHILKAETESSVLPSFTPLLLNWPGKLTVWNTSSITESFRQILVLESTSISMCRNSWETMKLLPRRYVLVRRCCNNTKTYSIQWTLDSLSPCLPKNTAKVKCFSPSVFPLTWIRAACVRGWRCGSWGDNSLLKTVVLTIIALFVIPANR